MPRKKRLKKHVHRTMNRRLKGCKKSRKGTILILDNSAKTAESS